MATAPSSSSSAITPQSSANPIPSIKRELSQDTSIGFMAAKAVKTEQGEEFKQVKTEELDAEDDPFAFLNSKEHMDKFKRYESELNQQLMQKYFSDKTIFGGNIFDVKMNIDGETLTASRLPQYQSYLDPAGFDEIISKGLSSSDETTPPPASTSNEKPPST